MACARAREETVDRVKVGKYWAEPLTAMVMTSRGQLMLTRILPDRWVIQTPGSTAGRFTPTWNGEEFIRPDRFIRPISNDELGEAVNAAAKALPDLSGQAVSSGN